MKENMRLKGHYELTLRNVETGEVQVLSLDNQLTSLYQASVLNQLCGNTFTDLQIKYIAIGTGTTPATKDDTKLEAETFRRQPTRQVVNFEGGYVITTVVLFPAEAVGTIREIGVFVGANASSQADSGVLISRMNINIEKTSSVELAISRYDYVII